MFLWLLKPAQDKTRHKIKTTKNITKNLKRKLNAILLFFFQLGLPPKSAILYSLWLDYRMVISILRERRNVLGYQEENQNTTRTSTSLYTSTATSVKQVTIP